MPEGRPSEIDRLEAETAALERTLCANADWRALCQLEAREAEGEVLSAVPASQVRSFLLQRLRLDPDYGHWQTARAALESLMSNGKMPAGNAPSPAGRDNLTRIAGIGADLARRLHALDVWDFDQIANWTQDDVRYVSATLGLGETIKAQNWIGQAVGLIAKFPARSKSGQHWAHAAGEQIKPAPNTVKSSPAPSPVMPLWTLSPPMPLAAWHYAAPPKLTLSLQEALAILGLSELDVRTTLRKVPLPAPPSVYALPRTSPASEIAAPRASDRAVERETASMAPVSWDGPIPLPLPASAYAAPLPVILPKPGMPLPAWAYALAETREDDLGAQPPPPAATSEVTAVSPAALSSETSRNNPAPGDPPRPRVSAPLIVSAEEVRVTTLPGEARVTIKPGPASAEPPVNGQAVVHPQAAAELPLALPGVTLGGALQPFDSRHYAGYRETIEEAEVEIVNPLKSNDALAQMPPPIPAMSGSNGERGAFARLLRALIGN
jgi:predicted flap endonuclease-1-like 5' DNA nuclease